MIEAMTNGGFKKKGTVLAPKDALEGDPVIFKYVRIKSIASRFSKKKDVTKLGIFLLRHLLS